MKHTVFKLIIFPIFIICIGCNNTFALEQQEEVNYVDLFLLSLSEDTQNYVLAIQFLEEENSHLKDLLKRNLSSKIDDLILHIATANNQKTINLVCATHKRTVKDILKITNNCASMKLCEINYHLTLMCLAKQKNKGDEGDETQIEGI